MIAAFRKHLSAPGLLKTLRSCFHQVPDHRSGKPAIPLVDALMSGLAVFGLKYPSLLKFDEERHEGTVRHNLSSLYGVERAPCDTQLREILDPVDPRHLRPAYFTSWQFYNRSGQWNFCNSFRLKGLKALLARSS